MPANGTTIEAAEKSLRIVASLGRDGASGPTALADRLGLSKSTVHHHLGTLSKRGYVVQTGDEYRLSLRFLEFGEKLRRETPVYSIGRSEVSNLAEELNQPTHLLVEEHGAGFFLMAEDGKGGFPNKFNVGERIPLHTTAAGKAILASLPDERVEEMIEENGLARRTPRTTDAKDELLAELETIRRRGYASERGQHYEGRWSVAAPVVPEESVLGAVGISFLVEEHDPDDLERRMADKIRETVEIIEIKSDYS